MLKCLLLCVADTAHHSLQMHTYYALQMHTYYALQIHTYYALQMHTYYALQMHTYCALQMHTYYALQMHTYYALQMHTYYALQVQLLCERLHSVRLYSARRLDVSVLQRHFRLKNQRCSVAEDSDSSGPCRLVRCMPSACVASALADKMHSVRLGHAR